MCAICSAVLVLILRVWKEKSTKRNHKSAEMCACVSAQCVCSDVRQRGGIACSGREKDISVDRVWECVAALEAPVYSHLLHSACVIIWECVSGSLMMCVSLFCVSVEPL